MLRSKPVVFLHIATIGNFQEVFDELIGKLIASELIPGNADLVVGIVGMGNLLLPSDVPCLISRDSDVEIGEFFTLNLIKKFVIQNQGSFPVAYIHSKGVSTPNSASIRDWRAYMSYFVIDEWAAALRNLGNYDAIGVDFQNLPAPHFSGNYWWANSSYLDGLPDMEEIQNSDLSKLLTPRHSAEFWIGSGEGSFLSLWNSGISPMKHHLKRYPRRRYIRKPRYKYHFLVEMLKKFLAA